MFLLQYNQKIEVEILFPLSGGIDPARRYAYKQFYA
jgi:hypothetical protein